MGKSRGLQKTETTDRRYAVSERLPGQVWNSGSQHETIWGHTQET